MKTSADSKTIISQVMMPNDANHYGTVHGGVILKLIDSAGWVCAVRHAEQMCVTASIDRVNFCSPIKVGELVTITAQVVYIGRTSMEIIITVTAEDLETRRVKHTNTSYVTMVAVTKQGKPTLVPKLRLTTQEEKRLSQDAEQRRKNRTKKQ